MRGLVGDPEHLVFYVVVLSKRNGDEIHSTLIFFILLETWLYSNIENAEMVFNRFSVYRSDRDNKASGKSRGGGVLNE